MDYSSALCELEKISKTGSKPGLERIRALLEALGNPQKNFKCILVGGTNGKGSTTAFISSILEQSGFKAGSFYSPHILSFRQRIQINSKFISKKDFSLALDSVLRASEQLEEKPTFFETITAMALLHFAQKKCDYAVLEVGMGGRLDATNACEPILSIITSIGLDHTAHLGATLKQISFEKAGIMRKNIPVICGEGLRAKKYLEKLAKEKGATFYPVSAIKTGDFAKAFASFELNNIKCALLAGKLLGITEQDAKKAILQTPLPARWQKIGTSPSIIADCAHNPHAMRAILPELKKDFSYLKNSRRVLLYTSVKEKDHEKCLKTILPFFECIIICQLEIGRAQSAQTLYSCAKRLAPNKKIIRINSPKDALVSAKKEASKGGRILIAGSIYMLQSLFCKDRTKISG